MSIPGPRGPTADARGRARIDRARLALASPDEMLISACLQHWYTSVVFFAPVPIVGVAIWLHGRRLSSEDDDHDGPHDQAPA
jgi:hypothetical protein